MNTFTFSTLSNVQRQFFIKTYGAPEFFKYVQFNKDDNTYTMSFMYEDGDDSRYMLKNTYEQCFTSEELDTVFKNVGLAYSHVFIMTKDTVFTSWHEFYNA